jgi:hypothetical protein
MPVAKITAMLAGETPHWTSRRTSRFTTCALAVARVASETTISTESSPLTSSSIGGEAIGSSSAAPIWKSVSGG